MKRPEPFEVFQPVSIREACELFSKHGPGGHLLAGGTDLVIAIKEKGLVPRYVVDLKKIPSLTGIREASDGSLTIGALTTMREIETSLLIRRKYPFLAQSAAEVGSIQIRNRATIGGNMANATPSADVAPTPIRTRKAEALLLNREITASLAERVGEEASNECKPISDVRSSAAYRKEMVRVNTRRALLNAAAGYVDNLSWTARRDRRYS